ncbi:sulfur carrier protein ThiS [Blastococcus sp. TF02A-26]|uniref:sulfur carrier protein ThiS n=1 Tax=Blastococcus sp. TF02A-26 TaxID=2250577 RepID=UPI000DE86E09|nr:sulfur carrier protein ThiS [Blastococcus sp. TF02A-26]RBY88723.1 thiamine biosynthesis protein ThiS [Blastococcus sp. TF02A-26]
MQVRVNGTAVDVADGTTVAGLVAARTEGHGRVAVARNGDVVPRSTWETTTLAAGDVLEVLAPTAGG